MSISSKPRAKIPLLAGFQPLTGTQAVFFVLGATACFHIAYTPAHPGLLSLFIIGYAFCVVQLVRLSTTRKCFYSGLLTGLLCFAPQLGFFWTIFGPAAIALWMVLAFWLALFIALTHAALVRFGSRHGVWLIPFIWTGLEYFRSELYYLRFSWLNIGYAFGDFQITPLGLLGVYGCGFCATGLGAWFIRKHSPGANRQAGVFAVLVSVTCLVASTVSLVDKGLGVQIAGVQLEFPHGPEVKQVLDKLLATEKKVDLVVMSEYTLGGPPTQGLKDWCRDNRKFLIVGGKVSASGTNYYNTAFVINPFGDVVFQQAKCVPIQFFQDGLPAPEQKLWDSPWGKVGICICYDLSYARVTDELVGQGARLLIVPTMDVQDWGRHQHELHARVAPVRAAEYGIPIFRLASSGVSQGVDSLGRIHATAPFPGDGEMIFFNAQVRGPGRLPLDRWLAPACVGVTGLVLLIVALGTFGRKEKRD